MPKPRPLTPAEGRRTLVHRFGRTVDKLRQLNTKFGLRPYRVFLVHTKWSGDERGEGTETEHRRIELLPTPKVENLDALTTQIAVAATIPVGTIRVTEVSVSYTFDQLNGYLFPDEPEKIPEPYDFFYEVVEDGRHVEKEERRKFRLAAPPSLQANKIGWTLLLERTSEDRDREGVSQIGEDRD